MTQNTHQQRIDQQRQRKGRVTGTVIAASGLLAILAPVLVQGLGLQPRHEMLFYFFSLAGFVWALVNIYQIWRLGRDNQG